MPLCTKCSDVSQLCCSNEDDGVHEITVEDCSLSQARRSAVLHTSERGSTEALVLLRNELTREVLRFFHGYSQRREDVGYMEKTVMTIARHNPCVAKVVIRIVQNQKRGGRRQTEYVDEYEKMARAATSRTF